MSGNQTHMLKGAYHEIDLASEAYPDYLRAVRNPPAKLYVVGSPEALVPGLAVIGARKATPYGRSCARRFSRIAAEKGVVIVSGGARGCDSEAHRAALEARSKTVVFLGGGCDCIYPAEHGALFQRVVDNGGAVVSENPWDFWPLPYTFRERNRLIAGLADAVLIVEAGLPSGTFSTADEALEQGKEVLVVPGAITSQYSHGSNRLIAQGAVPIIDDASFEDALFRACGVLKRPGAAAVFPHSENPIVQAVLASPLSVDDLHELAVERFGAASAQAKLMESLAEAEAAHIIARQPDGKWGAVVPT